MRRDNTGSESGSVLIAVLFLIFLMAGMAGAMMIRSNSSTQATSRNNTETQLLMTAESGLNLNAVRMGTDPLYAVKDTVKFTVDATKKEYVGPVESVSMPGAVKRTFTMRLQYLCTGVPVVFANRANPKEPWTNLEVSVSAQAAGLSREVAGWYRYEMGPAYSAAIISDTSTSGASVGGGKPQAQTGDIVIDDKGTPFEQFLLGGIKANGSVWLDGSAGLKAMTTANATSVLGAFTGEVDSRLGGTAAQIPDFTDPGTSTQLFDFNRFEAAAAAGAGQVYPTVAAFVAAMNIANAAGKSLEGIIVVKTVAGKNIGSGDIPLGINIHGTLLFRFPVGTSPLTKDVLDLPININAANLSAWDPKKESTYTTGYPPVYSNPAKAPWSVNIAPTYPNFTADGDTPGLMFENGVVDMHGDMNICGAVYGPSFIEIENKHAKIQYVNGVVIGGAGVYIEANGSSGVQAFRFARDTIDMLDTFNNKGKSLVRTAFAVVR